MVDGREVEHDQRAVETQAGGRGPVEHAPQVAVDQAAQLEGHVPSVLHQLGPGGPQRRGGVRSPGSSRASTTWGRVGAAMPRPPPGRRPPRAASTAARSRGSRSRPRQATASEAVSAIRRAADPSAPGRPETSAVTGGIAVSSGLRRTGPPGRSATGRDTPGLGQRPVLALGVDHPGAASEHGLAPQVGLHEAALAPADLPDHDHVRVGDHTVPVEGERVVDERAAEDVAADQHALVAEAGLGDQRVGGAQVPGGGDVGREARRQPAAQVLTTSPRPRGSRQRRAASCCAVEPADLEPGLAGGLLEGGTGRRQLGRRRRP